MVLIPLKPLAEAKSRFREAFDDQARAELVRAMLIDVLTAVRSVHSGPLYLVTSDDAYDDIAARFEAGRQPDLGSDYSSAVAGALRSEAVRAAGAAVVLPADVPRATSADIAMAIESLGEAEVVLVAAADGGTGLLGLRPPDAIAPAFGVRSAQAHLQAAAASGRRAAVLNCDSLRARRGYARRPDSRPGVIRRGDARVPREAGEGEDAGRWPWTSLRRSPRGAPSGA